MEDETGLSNVIITPDTYAQFKRVVVDEPYLLVEGTLQNQDGAVSVKAERIESLKATTPEQPSRDFH
jgi:error-prone DNA polymerase